MKLKAAMSTSHTVVYHLEMLRERTYLQDVKISNCWPQARIQGLVLLSGRGSGLTSPSRTRHCCLRRSTNDKKRERLIRPTGRSCALMRAGAMKSIGEKGSAAIATLKSGTRPAGREGQMLPYVECGVGLLLHREPLSVR